MVALTNKQEKDNRLIEWLNSKPQEWEDIRDIIEVCVDNASNVLKSISCTTRDFHAGQCAMGEGIIISIENYKDMEVVKDGESEAQTSS